jgi:hypothetical protein
LWEGWPMGKNWIIWRFKKSRFFQKVIICFIHVFLIMTQDNGNKVLLLSSFILSNFNEIMHVSFSIVGCMILVDIRARLVIMQPTIKIEIWSQKAKIGLIGVWHNGNQPQGTTTIRMSRMTPQSHLIFDKSDSVCSRTEECNNHSHVKTFQLEVILMRTSWSRGHTTHTQRHQFLKSQVNQVWKDYDTKITCT